MDNVTCYSTSHDRDLFTEMNFITVWLVAIILVTLFAITVTTNGAIIVMFASNSSLRRYRNTYIMSLALADLLIGLTLPLSIFETLGEKWMLSDGACIFLLTIRYSLYYVIIMSIVLVSVDRWWSVNFPFSYRIRRSKKMALILAALVWVLSFVIHIPTIGIWNILHLSTPKRHKYCRVPYEYNSGFTISASVIEFFVPLVILLTLYAGLYIKLSRRRNNKTLRRSLSTSNARSTFRQKSMSESDNTGVSEELTDLLTSLQINRCPVPTMPQYMRSSCCVEQQQQHTNPNPLNFTRRSSSIRMLAEYTSLVTVSHKGSMNTRRTSRVSISSKGKSHDDAVRDFLFRQDNKALLSLGLLVIMIVICWTPATLCDIVYSLCPTKVPLWGIQLSYWIQALNSAINPLIYGIGNSDFRRVAKRWLALTRPSKTMWERILYNQLLQVALRGAEHPPRADNP